MKTQFLFLALVLTLTACGSSKSAEGGGGAANPSTDGANKPGANSGNSNSPNSSPNAPVLPAVPGFPLSPAPSPIVTAPVLTPARGTIWNCLSTVTGKTARVSGHIWDFGLDMSLDIDGEQAAPLDSKNAILYSYSTSQFCSKTQIGGSGLNVLVVNRAVEVVPKTDTVQGTLTRYRGAGVERECKDARGLREYDERLSMVCVADPSGTVFDQNLLGGGFGLMDLHFADRGGRILSREHISYTNIKFAFPSSDGGTYLVYEYTPPNKPSEVRALAVVRINSEGNRDTSYGLNGWFDLTLPAEILDGDSIESVNAVTDGPGGSFFVAGILKSRNPFFAHLNPDGQLNRDFLDRGFMKIVRDIPAPLNGYKSQKQGQLVFTGDALYFSLPYKYTINVQSDIVWSVDAGKIVRDGILDKSYVLWPKMDELKDVRFRANGEAIVAAGKSIVVEGYYVKYDMSYTILDANGAVKTAPVPVPNINLGGASPQFRIQLGQDGSFALIESLDSDWRDRVMRIVTVGADGVLNSKFKFDFTSDKWPALIFDQRSVTSGILVLSKDKIAIAGNWQGRLFKTEQPAMYFTSENGTPEEGATQVYSTLVGKTSFAHLGVETLSVERLENEASARLVWVDARGQINMLSEVSEGGDNYYEHSRQYVLGKLGAN